MTTVIIASVALFLLIAYSFYLYRAYLSPKRIHQIVKFIEAGNTKVAIKALKSLISKNERNVLAHWYLGESYFRERKMELAIVEFKYVLKLGKFTDDITEAETRKKLAIIYKEFGQLEESQKELILISNMEPENYEILFQIGEIFYLRNFSDNALSYFQKVLRLNPQHSNSYYYMGMIFLRSQKNNEAMGVLQKAIQFDPQNYKAHLYLGLVEKNMDAFDSASKEFVIAAKDPAIKQRALLENGKCYYEKGDTNSAIIELQRALKVSSEEGDASIEAHYYLADCYEKNRDLPSAIDHWERIAEVRPGYKDTSQKLQMYQELRTDDRLKDFLTASSAAFANICRKVIVAMGFDVVELSQASDDGVDVLATETESKWRNTRKSNRLVRIRRTPKAVGELYVRELHEDMKKYNATRGIFITSSMFSGSAQEYALTRPLDLIDKKGLIKILRQIE